MSVRFPAEIERLVDREVEEALGGLRRSYPRALEDNPAGSDLMAEALRRAVRIGLLGGFEVAGQPPPAPAGLEGDVWGDWQGRRHATPDGSEWPAQLEAEAPDAVARAAGLIEDAGAELGLHGRAARRLRLAGSQAAEAGRALAGSLTEPDREDAAPQRGEPGEVGPPQPDGTVRVAVVANQAEAELLQGVLQGAGIPSTWRRTGGDLPELLAAGYREIYVPGRAAEEAQALLATMGPDEMDEESPPARRVGLERTGLRLMGKATIAVFVAGAIASAVIAVAVDATVGLLILAALLIAIVAVVAWSELADRK
jgi:hypothetical protein